MMRDPIVVVNPNSTQAVTDGISDALEPLRMSGGPAVDCVTLKEGPAAIETQTDIDAVVEPLCRFVSDNADKASAFVIACYSDPGLYVIREICEVPTFGIAESAMLCAMTRGRGFGVISILEASVPRHIRYVHDMGLSERLAGDRAVGLGVLELADESRALPRLCEIGLALRDQDGADVLIIGCTGMARYRAEIEKSTGLPVIDPTQAAVTFAIGAVRLSHGA
ncbi:MAG: aspartate/glutamate racemase family protein [Gammaproteobacteria bacterium]|nr:aspartate/glutamate racemase family protein [Gammaproteobacteria bacterium]